MVSWKNFDTLASYEKLMALKGSVNLVYTPGELSCMSQYYYKRTSESGFYPSKVSCQDLGDGFYEILLFDEVKGEDGTTHNTSYAQYRVGTDAKGTDTVFGKEIDLTLYSKVYTADELCKLAQNHYYKTNDFYPPNVSYTANKDGTYTICMFEMILPVRRSRKHGRARRHGGL